MVSLEERIWNVITGEYKSISKIRKDSKCAQYPKLKQTLQDWVSQGFLEVLQNGAWTYYRKAPQIMEVPNAEAQTY